MLTIFAEYSILDIWRGPELSLCAEILDFFKDLYDKLFSVQSDLCLDLREKIKHISKAYLGPKNSKLLKACLLTRNEIVWKRRNFFCLWYVLGLISAQSFRKGTKSCGDFQ